MYYRMVAYDPYVEYEYCILMLNVSEAWTLIVPSYFNLHSYRPMRTRKKRLRPNWSPITRHPALCDLRSTTWTECSSLQSEHLEVAALICPFHYESSSTFADYISLNHSCLGCQLSGIWGW